jgi:hypothetical protein
MIFTVAQSGSDSGEDGHSWRNVIAITGNALDQIRLTFVASSAGQLTLDHASIGISNGTTMQTTATPTELLFSGASGFTIPASASITSDWVNFSGFTSSDKLVVVMDMAAAPAGRGNPTFVTVIGNTNYFSNGTPISTYNAANPIPGFSSSADQTAMVSLIEVQTAGGVAILMAQACM